MTAHSLVWRKLPIKIVWVHMTQKMISFDTLSLLVLLEGAAEQVLLILLH